jgi:hypothetical protein
MPVCKHDQPYANQLHTMRESWARELRRKGRTIQQIGSIIGIGEAQVYSLLRGEVWKR